MPLAEVDIDFLMNELRIELEGASEAGLKQALWGTIKEFLADTEGWIEQQQLLVTASVQEYLITPRDGGQVVRLVGVLDGNLVPVGATMPTLGTLRVITPVTVTSVDAPVTAGNTVATNPWLVCIVKNIQLPGTKDRLPIAPQFVLQVYGETIKHGVLGKVMLQAGKTWTNVPLAKYHLASFRDGIGIARTNIWRQNVQGGQRWAFPQSFATRTQRGYASTAQPWPQESF